MAAHSKRNKLLRDYAREDRGWKLSINRANESKVVWFYKWRCLLDEYKLLKAKMDEQTANSQMLKRIILQKKEDNRQLGKYPTSSNHLYGYVASNPAMQLETLGPDYYKPIPLPDMYKLIKRDS